MGKRNRHSTEQIIHKLREAEVELAKGRTIAEVCKQIGVAASRVIETA
jgi:putative transposase